VSGNKEVEAKGSKTEHLRSMGQYQWYNTCISGVLYWKERELDKRNIG
jgi:hypothetical protein